jgi:diguanylate cyclase (GGDEF)-like protein/PAS domain S-box-containing protein
VGRSDTTPVPGQAEGLLSVAADGRVRAANPAAIRVLGAAGPLVGMSVAHALSPLRDRHGRPLSAEYIPGVSTLTTGLAEPWRLVRALPARDAGNEDAPPSTLRWLLVAAVPDEGGFPGREPTEDRLPREFGAAACADGVLVSLIEVTDAGLDALREEAGALPMAGTGELLISCDGEGRFTEVSPAATALLGYPQGALLQRTWREQVHAADRETLFADQEGAVDDAVLGPEGDVGLDGPHAYGVRIRFRHAEGHYLWLECVTRAYVARTGLGLSDQPVVLGLRTVVRDVTVEVEMEIRQGEAERQLSLTLDNAPIGMALVALDGSFLRVNQSLCTIVGYPAEQLMAMGFQEITHPDDLDADLSLLAQLVSGEIDEYALDKRYLHRDGRTVWVRLSMTLLCDEEDEPLHYISQLEDITERRQVQVRIADSERRYRLLAENASDIISRLNSEGLLLWLSPAVDRILGYPPETLVGTSIADLVHPRDRAGLYASLREVRSGRSGSVTARTRHRDGRWIWLESRLHAVVDDAGAVVELQSVSRDVTERQLARAELERLALTDPLTGLANRALLFNHLQSALARMRRTGGAIALMLIDLDRFKEINDTLGHPVGDELICQAAARLRAVARPSDTVARLGGDELVVLVDALPDASAAQVVADRILGGLREPYQLAQVAAPLSVTASMGISLTADPEQPVDDLYRQADLALYRAKDGGRDRWAFFEQGLDHEVRQRLEVHRSLRQAIDAGRLKVLYQPVVDLVNGAVFGAEALARVQDASGTLLTPDRWLGVAEETGLLGQIDAWVLQAAAAQAARWSGPGSSGAGPDHIAINVSAGAFADPRYCDALVASIRANGLAPESLRIELTEHTLLGDTAGARRALYRLASLGVGLGIDDFGTGYSSLSYLHQLPISFVKIDRSFISSMTTDSRRYGVVRAVIDLVHGLGHSVVAEGVETEQQLAALQALGCDAAQGFLFGRPVPAGEFDAAPSLLMRR